MIAIRDTKSLTFALYPATAAPPDGGEELPPEEDTKGDARQQNGHGYDYHSQDIHPAAQPRLVLSPHRGRCTAC